MIYINASDVINKGPFFFCVGDGYFIYEQNIKRLHGAYGVDIRFKTATMHVGERGVIGPTMFLKF